MDSKIGSEKSLDTSPTKASYDVEFGSPEECRVASPKGFRAWVKKLSIETNGIQRVTDEDRQQNTTKVWNACTFWYASFISSGELV
jgi:hypothetical protein